MSVEWSTKSGNVTVNSILQFDITVYLLLEIQNYKYTFYYKYIFLACAKLLVTQSLLVTESLDSDIYQIESQVAVIVGSVKKKYTHQDMVGAFEMI